MSEHVAGSNKKVLYTVKCPKDGAQYLRPTGLHVLIRAGMKDNVVTFFCPACSEQRWMVVDKRVTDELIDVPGVSCELVRVPAEALEPHYQSPISERWVEESVKSMARVDWPRL
jgi:hypothetical protein